MTGLVTNQMVFLPTGLALTTGIFGIIIVILVNMIVCSLQPWFSWTACIFILGSQFASFAFANSFSMFMRSDSGTA